MEITIDRRQQKFAFVAIMYIVLALISNILAVKLIDVFGITLTPGALIYPFSFMLGDVLAEVYGFQRARQVIRWGSAAQIVLATLSTLAILMPHPFFWTGQESFSYVFSLTPRICLASMAAYYFGSITNAKIMELMKKHSEKNMWMRTIGSTVVGELVDTGLFVTIAFLGRLPLAAFFVMIASQYIVKVAAEALGGTPLAYAAIRWARK